MTAISPVHQTLIDPSKIPDIPNFPQAMAEVYEREDVKRAMEEIKNGNYDGAIEILNKTDGDKAVQFVREFLTNLCNVRIEREQSGNPLYKSQQNYLVLDDRHFIDLIGILAIQKKWHDVSCLEVVYANGSSIELQYQTNDLRDKAYQLILQKLHLA